MKASLKKWIALPAAAVLARLGLLRGRRNNEQWTVLERYRYAHRGLHDDALGAPENSLAAFRRAVENGFGAELDVHLLADGTLAVLHDSDLSRMTGKAGYVEDLTAAELSEYPLAGTEQTIPQLWEVLDMFEGTGLPLVVELKSFRDNFEELTRRAVEELDRHGVPYCIESFDPRCLMWLRWHRDEIVRGQLAQNFMQNPSGSGRAMDWWLTDLLFNASAVPDFISYRFEDRNNHNLRLCRKVFGVRTFYWTIRSRADMETAERDGAQVIFEQFIP